MVKTYKQLIVWQKAIELVVLVYKLTEKFPKSELFGITSQIRRAAVAIAANIAEGQQRNHRLEFIQFLGIAYGSAAEVETYLEIIRKLNYADEKEIKKTEEMLTEILKMLNTLISVLKKPVTDH